MSCDIFYCNRTMGWLIKSRVCLLSKILNNHHSCEIIVKIPLNNWLIRNSINLLQENTGINKSCDTIHRYVLLYMYYILCIKVSLFHELVITNKFFFVVWWFRKCLLFHTIIARQEVSSLENKDLTVKNILQNALRLDSSF